MAHFFLCQSTTDPVSVCNASDAVRRLVRALLTDYDVNVRPVEHPQQAVNVSMALDLKQIIDLVRTIDQSVLVNVILINEVYIYA